MLITQIAVLLQRTVDDVFELGGRSGFSRKAGSGVRFMMPSKINPVLSPRKGNAPVAIS